MTVYQLDECINSKRFASDCEANAAVRVWRYPNSLRGRGASDAEMLATLLQKGNPILTTDLRLLSEWSDQIPDVHPGIVVVGHTPLQERFVRRVLAHVKSGIPGWASIPISNSILTISEVGVEVHRVHAGVTMRIGRVEFNDSTWSHTLLALLRANQEDAPET